MTTQQVQEAMQGLLNEINANINYTVKSLTAQNLVLIQEAVHKILATDSPTQAPQDTEAQTKNQNRKLK